MVYLNILFGFVDNCRKKVVEPKPEEVQITASSQTFPPHSSCLLSITVFTPTFVLSSSLDLSLESLFPIHTLRAVAIDTDFSASIHFRTMDLPAEELQFLTLTDILKESVSIPKYASKTFYNLTLTLIFPLSFAILAHSLFTHPLFSQLQNPAATPSTTTHPLTLLLLFQFFYLIFLFAFSLLSTAAVVFTVASLYTSKPVSFSSTMSAIPRVFKRLFITFLYISLLMILYNLVFIFSLLLLIFAADTNKPLLFLFSMIVIFVLFLVVHTYITALWHLASVVSVLEPIYGFAAMKKSWELLKGRTRMAAVLVFGYLSICGVINVVFATVVVHGGEDYGVFVRIVVGGFLVGLLVIVNLVGLLTQSVFYYVCKSYHHQGIDKSALHDHLGGYLGEYVPLKSSIQMENLDV